jgi:hypothetical protein
MFEQITGKQNSYLARLILRAGKQRYIETKQALGLHGLTILQLTKAQAARLISELRREVG